MPCKVKQRRVKNHWITKRRVNHSLSCKLQVIKANKNKGHSLSSEVASLVASEQTSLAAKNQISKRKGGLITLKESNFSVVRNKSLMKANTEKHIIKGKPLVKKKSTSLPTHMQTGKLARTPEGQDSAEDDKLNHEEMFDWNEYLKRTDALSAPQSAFEHVHPLENCCFEPGMKLECPNKDGSGTFWLATIVTKAAPLVLLRYEGYEDDNCDDFWVNVVTDDIHPVGWCSRTKHSLRPPKAIQHKQKDWYQYLIKHLTGARKAADSLFNTVSSPLSDLKAGLLLEVIDSQDPKRYWFASITEVYAGRLRLQYKGITDSDGELWMYYLDERLQTVGEGLKKQMTAAPPGALLLKISNDVWPNPKVVDKWQNHEASKCLTAILKGPKTLQCHTFTVGMKLEAKHPRDPTKICVATIARVYDEFHFLIRIDNLLCTAYREGENSVVCHRESHGIYPIGWCNKHGVTLHPPKGYNGHFTWNSYLKYCKAVAAPETCFDTDQQEAPEHGFKLGMKLEAVDQEEPSRVCVATVTFVVGGTMWVTLDGESRSEQIFDAFSFDLFPAGWCSATGHELQWPRPDTIEQKNRISRLRVTSDRITRLETLRKGRFKRQNSYSGGSNENSDHESPAPKKSKKVNNARYVRGRKQIKSKEATEVQYNVLDRRYIDPTMPYVCIHEIGLELNTEDQIKKSFNLDADGNLPKVIVELDSDDDEKEKAEEEKESKHERSDLNFLSYLGIKPNKLTEKENRDFFTKRPLPDDDEVIATVIKMPTRSTKGSLDSIVAMLRNNNKPKLLDSFRKDKGLFMPNGKIHLCAKHMHQYTKKVEKPHQHSHSHSHGPSVVTNGSLVRTKSSMISTKQQRMAQGLGDRVKNSYPAFVGKNLTAVGVEQPVVTNRPVQKGAMAPYKTVISGRRDKTLPSQTAKVQTTRVTRNKENISNAVGSTVQTYRYSNDKQYRVVKNIVSDEGPSSKIVIKLARPTTTSSEAVPKVVDSEGRGWQQPSDCPLVISDVRSVAAVNSQTPASASGSSKVSSQIPTTITLDDDDDDIDSGDPLAAETRREVKELCRDLPANPARWEKHDVAKFIGLADCQPFARIFTEQDVDGPAFLLLTIHEIHKILGVTLGPAVKLSAYIQTLKRISEDFRKRPSISS